MGRGHLFSTGLLLAIAGAAQAQPYDLSWFTIDGGGFTFSTGGGYELGGTIGQPDAGPVMTGGGFELTGGFWPGLIVVPGTGPKLVSAVSRRTHGAAGAFDVPLPLDPPGTSGVEPRQGGPAQIVLTFDKNIKALDGAPGANEVTLSGGTLGTVSISGSEMTIELSGVPNGTCLQVSLAGLADLSNNPLSGDTNLHIVCLHGDVNGDSLVASADITQIKSRSGQDATAANFRWDVNADGIIASADITQVKSRSGQSVSCP